jgi:Tfp pilus assembly protein PilX
MRQRPIVTKQAILRREDGIAMLTMLMLTVILTVIGIAAITTTTMDLRLAGGERLREVSINSAEACLSSSVQIIQQTLMNSAIPASITGPSPMNPVINAPITLQQEIMGVPGFEQSTDSADINAPAPTVFAPNATLTIGTSTVDIDIDRLFARPKPGSSLAFAAGYEGTGAGAAGGGVEVLYRISCYSRGAANTFGQVTGVYACVATGESCQRKI